MPGTKYMRIFPIKEIDQHEQKYMRIFPIKEIDQHVDRKWIQ